MANRYWVGGTALWDGTAGTKWALTSGGPGGETVPTSADDVFFDAASGANTVTIAAGNTGAKSITCTGFTGTLAGTAAITVSGNLTLVAGMTVTYTGVITFNATSTVITAGKTLGGVTVNGSGITVTLGSALTLNNGSVTATLTVTQGTFNTANFNVTSNIYNSNNSNTRAINLGSSTVTAAGSASNPWEFQTTTNLTFNAGTSSLNFDNLFNTINFGGLTYYNVNLPGATVGRQRDINGANTFNNLTLGAMTGGSSGRITYSFIANQTVNGALATFSNFPSRAARSLLRSRTYGTPVTFTVASLGTFQDIDFMDITVTGAAAPLTGTSLGNQSGNSGITFTAAKTVYCVGFSTNNWYSNSWATSSGGSASSNNFPLPQDTGIIDDGSGASGGTMGLSAIASEPGICALDFTNRSNAVTISQGEATRNVFFNGSLTLSSAVTITGAGKNTFVNRTTTLSIMSAGKPWTQAFDVQSIGATVSLADNCTVSNTVTLTNGTLDLNGKILSGNSFITAAGTKNLTFNGGTIAVSNATMTAWNNAEPTGFTTTAGTGTGKISMTAATAKTFVGGGSTYNCTLSNDGSGALTITGSNTFTTLANGVQPTTFTFTAGTTTIVTNWSVSGTAGNLVTIGSATAASHTLSKSSGIVNADYLSISRSTAIGGATWYAGANSTNGGNNSGWIFTALPVSAGNFFLLF